MMSDAAAPSVIWDEFGQLNAGWDTHVDQSNRFKSELLKIRRDLRVRYLLLGLGAYAIVRFSEISLTAALVGLFVSTAAVILEILIELIYVRT